MDSFKNESKNRVLSEYYSQILEILVTLQFKPTQSLGEDEE